MDTIIGTGITLVVLGVIIGLIIKSMVKDKKQESLCIVVEIAGIVEDIATKKVSYWLI